VFVEIGAFYISKVKNIIESQNRISGKIGKYETPEYTYIEIDEPEDWLQVESTVRMLAFQSPTHTDIKLFLSDMDDTLIDSGMYYSESGDELKRFCAYDGKALEILRKNGIKTGMITSENTKMQKIELAKSRPTTFNRAYQKIKTKDCTAVM
jgi:hypothetical protein